jgi:hypothetical protein
MIVLTLHDLSTPSISLLAGMLSLSEFLRDFSKRDSRERGG